MTRVMPRFGPILAMFRPRTAMRHNRRPLAYPAANRRHSEGPPIFIVGCPGSGAHALGSMLDRHSRIACAGETWYLANFLEQLRMHYWKRGLKTLGVFSDEAAVNIHAAALWYYEQYLWRAQKARWADSTSIYVDYAGELHQVFGRNVRIVHVLRHGFDAVDWMKDNTWHSIPELPADLEPLEKLELAARTWTRAVDGFEDFQKAQPELCHTVRFEELIAKPEEVARGVLSFIGERWEPQVLDALPAPSVSGGHRLWPDAHRDVVSRLMVAPLARHGYSLE